MAVSSSRDFGSFHVSNVEALLEAPFSLEYPFERPQRSRPRDFGEDAKSTLFFLSDDFTFLNHGAFGGVARPCLETANEWRRYVETQPVRFMDRQLFPLLVSVLHETVAFLKETHTSTGSECNTESRPVYELPLSAKELFLFDNVTTATNTVLRSVLNSHFSSDFPFPMTVLYFNVTYGSTKKFLKELQKDFPTIQLKEVEIVFPLTDVDTGVLTPLKEACEKIQRTVPEGNSAAVLSVIDAIPSNAPVVLPVRQMNEIVRGFFPSTSTTFVDGAHLLGSTDLSLEGLGSDYVVCNFHKWLCAPKGTALLFAASAERQRERRKQRAVSGPNAENAGTARTEKGAGEVVKPLVISHAAGSCLAAQLFWTGLKDFSAWLSLPSVYDFWREQGVNRLRDGIHGLMREGATLLSQMWGTGFGAPLNLFASMALVELPASSIFRCPPSDTPAVTDLRERRPSDSIHKAREEDKIENSRGEADRDFSFEEGEMVQNALFGTYNVEVPVKKLSRRLYVRISAHMYNSLKDFEALGKAVLGLVETGIQPRIQR